MGMFEPKDLPFAKPAPVVQAVGAWLPGRVPTVGLHHKGVTVGKGGRRLNYDRPELKAAKAWYAQQLPPLPAPVAGPVRLWVEFVLTPERYVRPFAGVLPYTGKPDRSNLVKLFEDALADAGWLANDKDVVATPGGKWISHDPDYQGVWFWAETVTAAEAYRFQIVGGIPGHPTPRKAYQFPLTLPGEDRAIEHI